MSTNLLIFQFSFCRFRHSPRGLDSMSLSSSSSLPFVNAFLHSVYLLEEIIYAIKFGSLHAHIYISSTYPYSIVPFPFVFKHVTSPWVKSIKSHATIWWCRYSPVPIDECNNQICIFTENCTH